MMRWLWYKCVFGPKLYYLYGKFPGQATPYPETTLEKYGGAILGYLHLVWRLKVYTFPLIAFLAYRRDFHRPENLSFIFKYASAVTVVVLALCLVRGTGRWFNTEYRSFIQALTEASNTAIASKRRSVNQYDFDFSFWPVDYEATSAAGKFECSRRGVLSQVKLLPCRVLGYFVVNTFGRAMLYPGSIGMLQMALGSALTSGRAKLVENYKGQRYKVKTKGGNDIDCMFIDRRSSSKDLVICSEGNAGFYEIGIMMTPTQAGYSVLGWNHPGFGGSTGRPDPAEDTDAIDGVIQFAIEFLGYEPKNIILYAWSIGGFSATWAAQYYPDIKALILDATFDNIIALALSRFPPSWESLVTLTVKEYFDLDNKKQLARYKGPIRLIRRTLDEIIATEPGQLSSNRGNFLAISILESRFPYLLDTKATEVLKEWLGANNILRELMWQRIGVDEEICESVLSQYVRDNGATYPLNIGDQLSQDLRLQLTLYLANLYVSDYEGTHCLPLPKEYFQLPWDINNLL